MNTYELLNVPIKYPEDYKYRHHYLEGVIHSILIELVANETPANWVLGDSNREKIVDLIVESSQYRLGISSIYLSMLKAAFIAHSDTNKAKLILLGLI